MVINSVIVERLGITISIEETIVMSSVKACLVVMSLLKLLCLISSPEIKGYSKYNDNTSHDNKSDSPPREELFVCFDCRG
jgi:hypothetical protein